ncbi:MAG TPA: zinc ribbon domain-containing protein [Cycloclasticus sp.]|jgi:hypothetical protein|nr:zinc ribbon domain-containing protein [Cycloclasticus sp.]
MAMSKCPECSSDVSNFALNCPSCGAHLKKSRRGFFGYIIKYSFIGFNILMLGAFISGMGGVNEVMNESMSDAEMAGATIGAGIGISMVLGIWAFGDIILGLLVFLTRAKS